MYKDRKRKEYRGTSIKYRENANDRWDSVRDSESRKDSKGARILVSKQEYEKILV